MRIVVCIQLVTGFLTHKRILTQSVTRIDIETVLRGFLTYIKSSYD